MRTLETVGRQDEETATQPQSHSFQSALFLEVGAEMWDSLTKLNAGWAALAGRRLRENFALPRQLAGCRSMADMLRVYVSYCCTAMDQYYTTFTELQQISVNHMAKVPIPVRVEPTTRSPQRATREWST
jgi:hypothetical protein